jgi:hypothetical protein
MKSRRTGLRGARIGGSAGLDIDRGAPLEPRSGVSYWCAAGHHSTPQISSAAEAPEQWDCDRCGQPAGRVEAQPPAAERPPGVSHKTPYEFLMMRRSAADGEALLDEALTRLRSRRAGKL